MEQRKIEVLLATYNGAAYIREQLDSILAQTYDSWTLTLSDDGSSDGTDGIIEAYAKKYPDKIRCVHSGRHFGNAKEHFMWLIEQSDADWIALSDQDDVIKNWKFERLSQLMKAAEEENGRETPVLVFSDQTPTDAQLNPLCDSLMRMQKQYTHEIDWRALVFQNVVTGGACMFNRALAKLACQQRDVSGIIMHDWWLAIVAARFGKVVYLNESTGYYRQHDGNSVGAKRFGSVGYVTRALSQVNRLRDAIGLKKRQASAFLGTYAGDLTDGDIRFLETFGKKKSGLRFYLRHRSLIHGTLRRAGFYWLG